MTKLSDLLHSRIAAARKAQSPGGFWAQRYGGRKTVGLFYSSDLDALRHAVVAECLTFEIGDYIALMQPDVAVALMEVVLLTEQMREAEAMDAGKPTYDMLRDKIDQALARVEGVMR